MAAELALAASYVISLLPKPVTAGFLRADWRYVPSNQLGGDCFGYHWIDDDHFAVYLLDVCGHGVGAALLSVSALNVLRSQTLRNVDFHFPEQVLTSLNESFQMEEHNNLYFTIWYGVYCKSRREIRFASGGHPPALLISADGTAHQLITHSFFIGGMPDSTYRSGVISVPDGQARLYVFSDEAYEVDRKDGAMWTLEELEAYLIPHHPDEAVEIDALYRFLQEMRGEETLDDDFSMLRITIA